MEKNCTTTTTTTTTPTHKSEHINSVFGNYGWICPVCGRGNSPYTSTCPCKPWVANWEVTCTPTYKTTFATSTTGGTINEAR